MQGKVLPEPNTMAPVYAGIDVCKEWLDVYVHAVGRSLRVANDGCGRRRLNRELAALGVTRVVMEATGKYHRAAQRCLHAAGFAVAVVDQHGLLRLPRRSVSLTRMLGVALLMAGVLAIRMWRGPGHRRPAKRNLPPRIGNGRSGRPE